MSDWIPAPYKHYRWIVADPDVLECLANGMSLQDVNEAYGGVLSADALGDVLRVASELTGSLHVAA